MKNNFLIVLLGISFIGCRKDIEYTYVSQALKEWGYYKPGSYWVYQRDDSTSIIDSFYVASCVLRHDSVYDDNNLVRIHEMYLILMKASSGSFTKLKLITHGSVGQIYIDDYDKQYNRWRYYVLIGVSSSGQFVENDFNYQYLNKYDSFILNGKEYYNVIQTLPNDNSAGQQIDDSLNVQYWLSKNNWIIQKKVIYSKYGTKPWSLIRSKIIQ